MMRKRPEILLRIKSINLLNLARNMKSAFALCITLSLIALCTSITPLNNLDLNHLNGVTLNAVAYNNVNDSWASNCLSFTFFPNSEGTQVFFNTTLWNDPTPENFTLNVTSNPAVWEISSTDNLYWVYADYHNEIYAFADELSMVSYVLSTRWTVSKVLVARAIVAMINAEVPSADVMTVAPANCSNTPMWNQNHGHLRTQFDN